MPTRLAGLAAAVLLLCLGVARLAPRPEPAAAAVGHRLGYHATVDGFTSWYGSYDMGSIGPAWCIDHGIRAPDPALSYVPIDLPGTPADAQVALAWALGRHGVDPDRPTAAALMLVAHDLMGAQYPSGDFDVDWIDARWLDGFGGEEAVVLARAQAIKADALAHRGLRPPWAIEVTADDPFVSRPGTLVARVTAGGVPVPGIELAVAATGTSIGGAATATITTGPDGTASVGFTAGEGAYRFEVGATVPDLALSAYAPTTARAQRVARAATVPLLAAVDRVGVVPTGQLVIRKVGVAGLPVAGARFEVRSAEVGDGPGESVVLRDLLVGPGGTTAAVRLPIGRYVVTEAAPPPGYQPAGPWTVDVGADEVTELEAVNVPIPTSTTTSTSTSSTSTTSTSTTSTSTTATSTSTTTTSSTTTTVPSTTTSTSTASTTGVSVLPATLPRTLPRTGGDTTGLVCIGAGLVLVGASLRPRRGLTTPEGHP